MIPDQPVELPTGQALAVEVSYASGRARKSLEERRRALREFFSRSAGQVNIPAEKLRREHIYEDRG
jgi:hypothetical protein